MTRFGRTPGLSVKDRLGITQKQDARNILNRKKLAQRGGQSSIQSRLGFGGARGGLISASKRRQALAAGGAVKRFQDFTVVTPSSAVRSLPPGSRPTRGGGLTLKRTIPNSSVRMSQQGMSKTIVNDRLGSRGPFSSPTQRPRLNVRSPNRQVAVLSRNPPTPSRTGGKLGSGFGMRATEQELQKRRRGSADVSHRVGGSLSDRFLPQRTTPVYERSTSSGMNMFVSALKSAQEQDYEEKPCGQGRLRSVDQTVEVEYEDESMDSTDIQMEEEEEDIQPITTSQAPASRLRVSTPVAPPRQPISGRLSSVRPKQEKPLPPVKGHRIWLFNLKESVTDEDVKELCSTIGDSLLRARLIEPGVGEAIYSDLADAKQVVQLYHNRELDGMPMKLQLADEKDEPRAKASGVSKSRSHAQARRAPDTSRTLDESREQQEQQEDRTETKLKLNKLMAQKKAAGITKGGPDPDRNLITQALFKGKGVKESQSVTFTVKI